MPKASISIEAAFHDIDAMGVVWHGHYLKYFELARTALFRRLGFDFPEMARSGYLWPVIEVQCRYAAPMRYGQAVTVAAALEDTAHRVKVAYEITDKKSGRRVAKGHTVQVAVQAKTGRMALVTPDVFLRRLKGSRAR